MKKCKSHAYALFNFKSILSPKRLMGHEYCIKGIDYEKDIINYDIDFIGPGDRVMSIAGLEWVPVQIRAVKLKIVFSGIEGNAFKKEFTFNYKKYEYRTKGKDFRRPGSKLKDK